jgi:copper homeostasis protein
MIFKLEICVDSVESAIAAQYAGAHRVELCDNLIEGGTTPSLGMINSVRKNLSIDVNVIIRPRGGDFLYTDLEYDIIRRDIDICGEAGVNGIVIGLLRPDGEIDLERTSKLVELAGPMSVTFHRAFDMCADPTKGLEDIIASGASRLLTSGQEETAYKGAELISKLKKVARDRIIIMPGGGINESNIRAVAETTGCNEFHLTARKPFESEMLFRKTGVTMGGVPELSEFSRKVADPEHIKSIIEILNLM